MYRFIIGRILINKIELWRIKQFYIAVLKTKEIIKRLQKDGWILVRQKGNHKVFKHPQHAELITLPDHGANKEPSTGVFHDIKKKAGW